MDSNTRLKLLRLLEANPDMSQRELAEELGISLGKVNYCLKALIDKGFVKAGNFRRNPDKKVYAYLLTPKGMTEKAEMTVSFLQRKIREYEDLKQEIAELRREVASAQDQS